MQKIQDFTTIDEFIPPILEAGERTPMGEAIDKALDLLEERKVTYKDNGIAYYRPWIFLITDGAPTDDWQFVVKRLHEAESQRRCSFFAVAVEGANMNILKQIAVKERPPILLNGLDFRELFVWLSSSMKRVSTGKIGEAVSLPPVGWGSVSKETKSLSHSFQKGKDKFSSNLVVILLFALLALLVSCVGFQNIDRTEEKLSETEKGEKKDGIISGLSGTETTLTPDGETLISYGRSNTVKMWNLQTGKLLHTLSGHSGGVWSVAISSDGQTIISGSEDSTVKVWNLQTGQLLRTLSGHSDEVNSVAISGDDGQTIVSGSYDTDIRVWKLD